MIGPPRHLQQLAQTKPDRYYEHENIAGDLVTRGGLFRTDIDQAQAVVLLAPDIATALCADDENPLGQSIGIG